MEIFLLGCPALLNPSAGDISQLWSAWVLNWSGSRKLDFGERRLLRAGVCLSSKPRFLRASQSASIVSIAVLVQLSSFPLPWVSLSLISSVGSAWPRSASAFSGSALGHQV